MGKAGKVADGVAADGGKSCRGERLAVDFPCGREVDRTGAIGRDTCRYLFGAIPGFT